MRLTAASSSTRPCASNGVTIAVRMAPRSGMAFDYRKLGGGGYLEEALNPCGEHQVALDLQLSGHEHLRAGGVPGHQLEEVDGLDAEGDPGGPVVGLGVHAAGSVGDLDAPVVVA